MNYRHGFHAGNFADVFKHALLTRLLTALTRKETPFRVIDTHAGEGAYDLSANEAERTGEWRDGVGRLADITDADTQIRDLLAPYLEALGPFVEARPQLCPGSPLIAQRFLRRGDRAIFCELREDAYVALHMRFARDKRIKTIRLDGYTGVGAFVPPLERRGLVLMDPPFERTDEDEAMFAAFLGAWRKWPTGVYALWRPIKDMAKTQNFYAAFKHEDVRRALRLELGVGGDPAKLNRTGLVVVNPPYGFEAEARLLLGFFAQRLARGNSEAIAETIVGE